MKKIKLSPMHIRAEILNDSYRENMVDVVFATSTPVRRFDWNENRYFNEVLDISAESMDMSRLASGAPVLRNHLNSLESVIGVVERAWIDNEKREARATLKLSEESRDAEIISKVKKGIIRNLSVGYKVDQYTVKRTEEEIPEYVATRWTPMEISFVAVPADYNSGVRSEGDFFLAEVKRENEVIDKADKNLEIGNNMKDEVKQTEAQTVEVINQEEIRQGAISEERKRVTEINDVCHRAGLDTKFTERLISEGVTIDKARELIIDEIANRSNPAPVNSMVKVLGKDESVREREAIVDGILHRVFPEKIDIMGNEKAQEYRGMKLLEIAKDRLKSRGERITTLTDTEIVHRAWATTDYPELLTEVFNKSLRGYYRGTVDDWSFIAREEKVTDYREKTGIKIDGKVTFEEIPEGGTYKESPVLQDEKTSIRLKKFCKAYGITDIAIINDDLGVFSRIPQLMAIGASQFQSDEVWSNITKNKKSFDGKALFCAEHGNLESTGSMINEESLSKARVAMRRQTSPAGHRLGITPQYLIVPPELQTTAEKVVSSILATNTGDVNVFSGALKVIVSNQLEDPKAWYLLADPNNISVDGIVYARRGGLSELKIKSRINWSTDSLEVKGSMEFATAIWGWQGWYKNAGK